MLVELRPIENSNYVGVVHLYGYDSGQYNEKHINVWLGSPHIDEFYDTDVYDRLRKGETARVKWVMVD